MSLCDPSSVTQRDPGDPGPREVSELPTFEDVHRHYASVVHGLLLGRVGRGEIEDLMQEVFLRVHQHLDEVREAARLPGWIVRITCNLAADHLRRRAARPRQESLDAAGARSETNDGSQLQALVLEHVRRLPEAYRDPLILRLVEGLSGPEIAARTGLTPGSVRVNLSRGMALLRPRLLDAGVLS